MSKKSTALKADIRTVEERRAELQAELDHAASEHAEAQQRLVRGFTAEAKQKAASAYAAYCSLKEALAQLDQPLEGKRQSLAAAEEHGQQTAARTRLTEIAIELSQAETQYRQVRVKADEALSKYLPLALAAHRGWKQLQDESDHLCARLGEPIDTRARLRRRISAPDTLQFVNLIDAALQQLLDGSRRPRWIERMQQQKPAA